MSFRRMAFIYWKRDEIQPYRDWVCKSFVHESKDFIGGFCEWRILGETFTIVDVTKINRWWHHYIFMTTQVYIDYRDVTKINRWNIFNWCHKDKQRRSVFFPLKHTLYILAFVEITCDKSEYSTQTCFYTKIMTVRLDCRYFYTVNAPCWLHIYYEVKR